MNDRCEITNDRNRFRDADAVVYHMRDPIKLNDNLLRHRRPTQRFIFALWESPRHTPKLHRYENFFNWTMTYRFDSHIFAGYHAKHSYHARNSTWFDSKPREGRERIVLHKNIDTTRKIGTVAALISNVSTYSAARSALTGILVLEIDKPTSIVDRRAAEVRRRDRVRQMRQAMSDVTRQQRSRLSTLHRRALLLLSQL